MIEAETMIEEEIEVKGQEVKETIGEEGEKTEVGTMTEGVIEMIDQEEVEMIGEVVVMIEEVVEVAMNLGDVMIESQDIEVVAEENQIEAEVVSEESQTEAGDMIQDEKTEAEETHDEMSEVEMTADQAEDTKTPEVDVTNPEENQDVQERKERKEEMIREGLADKLDHHNIPEKINLS